MGATAPLPSEDDWLTVKEIAEELRLTPATVRAWIAGGSLKAKRAGKRKWLVQRGELTQMLAMRDDGSFDRLERLPDQVLPPQVSPHWPPEGMPEHLQDIEPTRWLQLTTRFWWDYLEESAYPPPDADFVPRMRRIAESMARKAAAIANLGGEDPGELWHLQAGLPDGVLSRELAPEANRPGSAALWTAFDAAVAKLDRAMRSRDLQREQVALERLAIAMFDVIEQLQEMGYPWPTLTGFQRGTLTPDGRGIDRPLGSDGRPLRPPEPGDQGSDAGTE